MKSVIQLWCVSWVCWVCSGSGTDDFCLAVFTGVEHLNSSLDLTSLFFFQKRRRTELDLVTGFVSFRHVPFICSVLGQFFGDTSDRVADLGLGVGDAGVEGRDVLFSSGSSAYPCVCSLSPVSPLFCHP